MTDAWAIPDFLLVRNRAPLTPEQSAAVARIRAKAAKVRKADKVRYDRPKTWTPEAAAIEQAVEAQKEAAKRERLAMLKAGRSSASASRKGK